MFSLAFKIIDTVDVLTNIANYYEIAKFFLLFSNQYCIISNLYLFQIDDQSYLILMRL